MNRKFPVTTSVGLDDMTVTGMFDAVRWRMEW